MDLDLDLDLLRDLDLCPLFEDFDLDLCPLFDLEPSLDDLLVDLAAAVPDLLVDLLVDLVDLDLAVEGCWNVLSVARESSGEVLRARRSERREERRDSRHEERPLFTLLRLRVDATDEAGILSGRTPKELILVNTC